MSSGKFPWAAHGNTAGHPSQNLPFVGYDARLDAKTSERGQAGSSVILAMTTSIPLYESTDRASIGAMSFLSGTIDAR
jgi:hypothetical protein